jgi:hypothetical protein
MTTATHVIDCDADPFVPEGWKVEEHTKGGSLEWDPARVALYLSERQQGGGYLKGNELREELRSERVLNANALDYLLAHPELIPEKWRGQFVCFWGTIYRGWDGVLYVRYLSCDGGKWSWSCRWLDYDFYGSVPAVVLASN